MKPFQAYSWVVLNEKTFIKFIDPSLIGYSKTGRSCIPTTGVPKEVREYLEGWNLERGHCRTVKILFLENEIDGNFNVSNNESERLRLILNKSFGDCLINQLTNKEAEFIKLKVISKGVVSKQPALLIHKDINHLSMRVIREGDNMYDDAMQYVTVEKEGLQ